ncbi:TetR/AcrR family transcriptional regulator [Mesorhizobium sp. SB112]|uniref:TetR/AcrR family transcriptional regulator n=1 Tax=Mesorhizobium sp. SB112 TaxID=3151853 RepID=UPI003264E675
MNGEAEKASRPAVPEGGRAADTHERILRAATAEFSRYGFSGANTTRIVAAADCNIRMIYHYFGDKQGLYRAALERVYLALRQAEAELQIDQLPPQEGIESFISFTFDYMLAHPEFPLMMRVENLNEGRMVREIGSVFETSRPLMSRLGKLLDRGYELGVFRGRRSPENLYLSILGLSFVHIFNFHTAGKTLGLDFSSPEFLAQRRRETLEMVIAYLKDAPETAIEGSAGAR